MLVPSPRLRTRYIFRRELLLAIILPLIRAAPEQRLFHTLRIAHHWQNKLCRLPRVVPIRHGNPESGWYGGILGGMAEIRMASVCSARAEYGLNPRVLRDMDRRRYKFMASLAAFIHRHARLGWVGARLADPRCRRKCYDIIIDMSSCRLLCQASMHGVAFAIEKCEGPVTKTRFRAVPS